jgi:maleylacetoacetate isomerase
MHRALYVLMFITPFVGVVTFIWHGRIFDFGLFRLDFGVPSNRAVFRPTEDIHGYLAYALFALAPANCRDDRAGALGDEAYDGELGHVILYGHALSSASYRVRIALALKGLQVTSVLLNLRAGEQRLEEFLRINSQGFVPALAMDDGVVLTQSVAIIEYLDEIHPDPPLLPKAPLERARVRALTQAITCDVHPLNNLRVLRYLENDLQQTPATRDAWYRHWVRLGFDAIERWLVRDGATGRFCHGDAPTMADVCLVPQVFNARRFAVDLQPYPRIVGIDAACRELPAFQGAAPERQV